MKADDLRCRSVVTLGWTGTGRDMVPNTCGQQATWMYAPNGILRNWVCDDHADLRRDPELWQRIGGVR